MPDSNDEDSDDEMSLEMLSNHFLGVLSGKSRHVQRVASWLGLVLVGLKNMRATDVRTYYKQRLRFCYRGKEYVLHYRHDLGGRGGLALYDKATSRVVFEMCSMEDAERFYTSASSVID
jgi:hypothetical protein